LTLILSGHFVMTIRNPHQYLDNKGYYANQASIISCNISEIIDSFNSDLRPTAIRYLRFKVLATEH
jgi:hypothetical protein